MDAVLVRPKLERARYPGLEPDQSIERLLAESTSTRRASSRADPAGRVVLSARRPRGGVHSEHEDDQTVVLDRVHDPVVADARTPTALLTAAEQLHPWRTGVDGEQLDCSDDAEPGLLVDLGERLRSLRTRSRPCRSCQPEVGLDLGPRNRRAPAMISAITASAAARSSASSSASMQSLVLRRADHDGLTVASLGQEDRLVRGRLDELAEPLACLGDGHLGGHDSTVRLRHATVQRATWIDDGSRRKEEPGRPAVRGRQDADATFVPMEPRVNFVTLVVRDLEASSPVLRRRPRLAVERTRPVVASRCTSAAALA